MINETIESLLGPDYANGYICKHIIFILHRVLKVSRQSSLLYQHCLSTDELTALFIHADRYITDQSVLAEESVGERLIFVFLYKKCDFLHSDSSSF